MKNKTNYALDEQSVRDIYNHLKAHESLFRKWLNGEITDKLFAVSNDAFLTGYKRLIEEISRIFNIYRAGFIQANKELKNREKEKEK